MTAYQYIPDTCADTENAPLVCVNGMAKQLLLLLLQLLQKMLT